MCPSDEQPIDCEDGCGAPAEVTVEDSDDASGYRGAIHVCCACLKKRMERALR